MGHDTLPFEWLPAELREAVYRYLLITEKIRIRLVLNKDLEHCSSSEVIITGRDASSHHNQISPTILRVNRQIHNEALPVLYSKNTFSFTSLTSMRQFCRNANPGCEYLRHVEIATTGRFAFWQPMQQLLRAENLRSLVISVGPDDVKDKGWSEVVLEVADLVVRKAERGKRRQELEKISFVAAGTWRASGSAEYRACGSDEAAEQVRGRVERRLMLMGALPE